MRDFVRLFIALLVSGMLAGGAAAQSNNPPPNRSPAPGGFPTFIFNFPLNLPPPQQPVPPPPVVPFDTPPPPQIVYRDIPYPLPRPVFRDLPRPAPRPMLSQGRPALIDAQYEPQVLILLVDVTGSEAAIAQIAAEYGLTVLDTDTLDILGVSMVKFGLPPDQNVEQTARDMADDPRILGRQPNYFFEIAQDGAAPANMRPLQYAPEKLRLVAAHQSSTGEGVTVGVIDTAIDATHPEFAQHPVEQADVLGGPVSSRGHGTAMGGLIVANAALDGVAPGVRLISIRAFDATPSGAIGSSSFALAKALDQMAASGADVLNLSFAGPRDPLILTVMDRLEEMDMPVIAAAGNNGPDAEPVYPAAHRHAIAVTATDSNDAGFTFANLGMYVEVAAPGVDILSPQPDGSYDYETGTSAATAHVTGIVALMLAENPDLTTADIRLLLSEASRDLGTPGRDEVFGAGLVDAATAVASVARN